MAKKVKSHNPANVMTDQDFLKSLDITSQKVLMDKFQSYKQNPKKHFNAYVKNGEKNIISALKINEFMKEIDVPLQNKILEAILNLIKNFPGDKNIGQILYAIILAAIYREDKAIFDGKFLRRIDAILKKLNIVHGAIFLEEEDEISPKYREDLIQAYFSIWRHDPRAILGDLLYTLIDDLLDTKFDALSTHKIMKELNDLAPRKWAQLYFNLLSEDHGYIDEFVRKDVI